MWHLGSWAGVAGLLIQLPAHGKCVVSLLFGLRGVMGCRCCCGVELRRRVVGCRMLPRSRVVCGVGAVSGGLVVQVVVGV